MMSSSARDPRELFDLLGDLFLDLAFPGWDQVDSGSRLGLDLVSKSGGTEETWWLLLANFSEIFSRRLLWLLLVLGGLLDSLPSMAILQAKTTRKEPDQPLIRIHRYPTTTWINPETGRYPENRIKSSRTETIAHCQLNCSNGVRTQYGRFTALCALSGPDVLPSSEKRVRASVLVSRGNGCICFEQQRIHLSTG